MAVRQPGDRGEPIEVLLASAFAPLHRRALGIALGVTAGLGVFLLTAYHIVFQPEGAIPLDLLSQYFYGYRVDWVGAGVGALWAGLSGFVAGWLLAFVRNTVVAVWWRTTRIKAELQQTQDFLDHV